MPQKKKTPMSLLPPASEKRLLGKLAYRHDERNFKLAKYLSPALPVPPLESSWVMHVPKWGMYLNNQIGDCAIAGPAHSILQWNRYAGHPYQPTDKDVLKAYSAVSGYVPGDPSTDTGCVLLDVMRYWRATGIANHKILGFVQIDPHNTTELKQAVELFGNIVIGVQLPISAQMQTAWTVPDEGFNGDGEPGSWGGHCVIIGAYSPKTLTCITWGQRLKMSWNFAMAYMDEAWGVVSQDWIEKSGASPSGFNLTQLEQDLAAL
jgi:hypothetical protein